MFIAHKNSLVNPFLSAEALAWIFAVAGLQIVQDLLDPPCARHKAGDKAVADRQKKAADHGGRVEKPHAALQTEEEAVTATHLSPSVSWATLKRKVEFTPPEKATAMLP